MVKVWLFGIFADCQLKTFDAKDMENLRVQVNEYISNNPRWHSWKIAKEYSNGFI